MILRSMLSPKASIRRFLESRASCSRRLGRRTVAGENVSPAIALTISTYFACVRNISEDVGKMPFELYRSKPMADASARSGTSLASCCGIARIRR
jgi:phage portal protein BeeE